MKLRFRVVRSRYRERGGDHASPHELSVRHALGKARQAVLPAAARFVLGGDTIVWSHGCHLGKPRNRAAALKTLRSLAGKKHMVVTGLALWDRRTGRSILGCSTTEVWIKPWTKSTLEQYIRKVHPYDKAGAYAIQEEPKIVKKIRGSYSNVVGLPKELLRKILHQMFDASGAGCRQTGVGEGAG